MIQGNQLKLEMVSKEALQERQMLLKGRIVAAKVFSGNLSLLLLRCKCFICRRQCSLSSLILTVAANDVSPLILTSRP